MCFNKHNSTIICLLFDDGIHHFISNVWVLLATSVAIHSTSKLYAETVRTGYYDNLAYL